MKREGSNGLMAFWADIDEDYVLRYQQWHNCEHVAERVGIPGFNVGRRYRGIGDAPMFFMFYETDDAAVLKSEAYLRALNNPTPWTREALPHFRNPNRNIYALLASEGAPAPTEAPYTHVVRFNLPAETEAAAVDWHVREWLPRLAALNDVFRARLYRVDEAVSAIMTSERRIYGGGPGQQKFLALFETATAEAAAGGDWRAAEAAALERGRELARRTDAFEETSWLEFALYAPARR